MSEKKTEIQVPTTTIITDYCDQICGPCSEDATKDKSNAGFLNLELFSQEFESLQGSKRAPLMFSGGAPYLHPDFSDGFASSFIDNFEDVLVCTNGANFTPVYTRNLDYENNSSFREAVDQVKEKIRSFIHDNGERIVRLSLSANHYLPVSDISPRLKSEILGEAGISETQFFENAILGDDLYKRIESEQDPLVRIMQESRLYKRIQVLKEADNQLREEYNIDPNKKEAILYFCVAGAGLYPDVVEKNQHAVMKIFGIEEKHARPSAIYRYGCATNWPNAQEPPISQEPELVLRPWNDGTIVVYDSKYKSRIDKSNGNIDQNIGIIQQPGDLITILKDNSKLIDPKTNYDKQYK